MAGLVQLEESDMRIRLFARAAAGGAAALLAGSGLAFAVTTAAADLPDEAQVPSSIELRRADRAEDRPAVEPAGAGEDEAQARQADAEANHEAATAFAEQIREWTDCINDNATDAPKPRVADFDPKDGCEDVKPETTPGGQPFDPGADGDEGSETADGSGEGAPEDPGAEGRATADEHRGRS